MRRSGQLVSISIALGVALGGTTLSSGPVRAERAAQAAAWGPVVNLSAPEPSWNLLPTSVSVDKRGNTLAVWVHTDESRSPLMSAFRPKGRPWRHAVPVPGSRGAADADVAFDGAGEAVVTWLAGRRIVATRRTAGGSWTRPVTVYRSAASVEPRPPNSLDLAVNENGRAVLTWEGRGAKVAIGFSDGRWGRARTLSRRSGGADAVVDRWGRVTAVWGEGAWAGRVMTASRDVGERWTKPRPLTRTQVGTGGPIIALRRDGEVAVALGDTCRGLAGHPGRTKAPRRWLGPNRSDGVGQGRLEAADGNGRFGRGDSRVEQPVERRALEGAARTWSRMDTEGAGRPSGSGRGRLLAGRERGRRRAARVDVQAGCSRCPGRLPIARRCLATSSEDSHRRQRPDCRSRPGARCDRCGGCGVGVPARRFHHGACPGHPLHTLIASNRRNERHSEVCAHVDPRLASRIRGVVDLAVVPAADLATDNRSEQQSENGGENRDHAAQRSNPGRQRQRGQPHLVEDAVLGVG